MTSKTSLGDMLLERGLITKAQLERAYEVSLRKGLLIGQALVLEGYVPQSIVDELLAEQRQMSVAHSHRAANRVAKAAEGIIALSAMIGHDIGKVS